MIFKNRFQAGKLLVPYLAKYNNHADAVVLGLARGGVVTAAAVAQGLHLPLDVLCPRKIGAPFNPELAIGAVSDQGEALLNEDLIFRLGVSQQHIDETIEQERKTAQMRLKKFRQNRKSIPLDGKIVILVDDGLATGATMRAAIKGVQSQDVERVVVAIPVSPPDTLEEIKQEVDEVVCLDTPEYFAAVGQFYEDFSQTEDDEVMTFLEQDHALKIQMNNQSNKNQHGITIGLMGDVMIGRLVNEMLDRQPPNYIWGDALPLIQDNDLNVINLEAALTHATKKVPKVFNFKAQPKYVQSLTVANIGVANLANNHILDFAEEGGLETLQTLTQAKIPYVGAGRNIQEASKPIILNIQGIRLGILGCTDNEPSWEASPQRLGTRFVEIEDPDNPRHQTLISDIISLRSKVDVLILSIHWGPNMRERPTKAFRTFAHKMIEAGVDILHGHSAHIFQGIEVYKQKLILYDTGDFVDDYYVDPILRNDRSFLFLVTLSLSGLIQLRLVPVLISNCQVNLADENDAKISCSRMQALSEELHTSLDVQKDDLLNICSYKF